MSLRRNSHAKGTVFDAIIVGSGATGSWAAKLLTEGGLSVLVLDSGNPIDDSCASPSQHDRPTRQVGVAEDPLRSHPTERQNAQSRCYAFGPATHHLFVDDVDQPYTTPNGAAFSWIRTNVVGGRTVLWHRVALRMSDRQFGAASLDGFEVDWPIRYKDLQPHYDVAERFLRVTGIEAALDEVPDGVFLPLTLPIAGQMFQQAIQERWPERRVTALRRVGLSEPLPHDAGRNRRRRFPACSAGDALAAADHTTRMTIRPNSRVISVTTDRCGRRAEGVAYVDCLTGTLAEARGKVVLLCASTIETTRIMLHSISKPHHDGIGNCNGLLGKYLMDHTFGVSVTGLRPGCSPDVADIYVPNFRNRCDNRERFLRGYGIQGHIKSTAKNTLQCDLMCLGEVLPRAANRVVLGRRKDKWGIPIPHISYAYSDNEFEMAADQAAELEKLLSCSGFDITDRHGLKPPGLSIHEVGTARMGRDPKTSVLNPYNQCWCVPNLFVTDGAAFPTTGFQNPTLTMMAITGRACEYILAEFRRESMRPFRAQ